MYYPPLKYSEIDEDYYFCPLPRFKQHTSMNPTGNQNAKPFLERKVRKFAIIFVFTSHRVITSYIEIKKAICRCNHRVNI